MIAMAHRYPIRTADICRLGGIVSVHAGSDRCDGTPIFRVGYISGGGDLSFTSMPIQSEDHAFAAARVVAELVGGIATTKLPEEKFDRNIRGGQFATS